MDLLLDEISQLFLCACLRNVPALYADYGKQLHDLLKVSTPEAAQQVANLLLEVMRENEGFRKYFEM